MSSILTNRHELQCCLSDFPYPSVQCSAKHGEFTRYSQRPRLSRKWYDLVLSLLQFGLGVIWQLQASLDLDLLTLSSSPWIGWKFKMDTPCTVFLLQQHTLLASPQTSFGVHLSRIHFSPTDVVRGEKWMRDKRTPRTSAGRLHTFLALLDKLQLGRMIWWDQ